MALRKYRPVTPGTRFKLVNDFDVLTASKPEKSLVTSISKSGGRNNTGQIMVRHIGGRHQRRYRLIDFRRDNWGIPGVVVSVEYDPNRTSRIALINFINGDKRYIIHPEGLKVGDKVMAGPSAEIKAGNALPISAMPEGSVIHNIELVPGKGGQIVRSAGASAQLMAKEKDFCQVRLPSGEIRLIPSSCVATLGQVGNLEHENLSLGNAGRSRHFGIRPTVRGTAMNSVDHPHGGGRGKSKGNNQPRSPWNQPAKGYKTRTRHQTDKFIVRDRRANKAVVSAA